MTTPDGPDPQPDARPSHPTDPDQGTDPNEDRTSGGPMGPSHHSGPGSDTGPNEQRASGHATGPGQSTGPSHPTGPGQSTGQGEATGFGQGPAAGSGYPPGPGFGHGHGPGGGQIPGTVPSAQPQSRGCAVVGVIAAVLVVVLLVAGAIWFVVSRDVLESGDFEAAPECSVGETEALDELVPEHELEVQEPIGGPQDTFGSGQQCRWATPGGEGGAVPATATLVTVVAPDPGGVDTAADNLRSSAGRQREPLDGLGDEAFTWVRSDAFVVGCAGVRISNLYLETCHGAAADYDATRSIDEEQAVAGAVRLAEDAVAGLPD